MLPIESPFFFINGPIDIKDEQEQVGFEGLTMKVFPDCKVLAELVYSIYHQNTENATLNNGKTLSLHKVQDVTSQAKEHHLYYR